MNKNKYYTPTKEEFHIGFESEVFNPYSKEWYTYLFEQVFEDTSISYQFTENKYRVKYLDKDDIEDLGFISSNTEKHLYYLGDVSLQLHNDKSLTIKYKYKFNDEWRTAVECIDIKNKSELKVLLKQLNIL